MPSPAFDVHLGNPDPGFKPTNLLQLYNDIDSKLSGTFQNADSYKPYIISATTPSVEDNDKVWIRTDSSGRPIGQFIIYGGVWRKIPEVGTGQVRLFIGNPLLVFDGNGLGIVGSGWDGWHLLNGKDGVPNFSDRVICGGHMDNSSGETGYSTVHGWQSMITGTLANGGGFRDVTLTESQIPREPKDALTLYRWTASGSTPTTSGDLYGRHNVSAGVEDVIVADPGNTSPDPVPIIPPYIVLALAMWVGYA